MMGATKLMQNKRFIQCPSFGQWFMSRTRGVRCNVHWKLFHSCTLGMSWRTSEYSWAYRDGKPGLPCLAWRATILRYLSLDAPGHVIFLPGRWIECRAQLQIMKPVFCPSCDSAWSAGAPIALVSLTYYAKFTHMNHFRKVVDCEEAGLIFNCIDSLFLWKS